MNERPLTIAQANRSAAGKAHVSVDPVDPTLWRVEDDDRTEAHEPMTRRQWMEFLAQWES